MSAQQQFWENLKSKYEEKNKSLLNRELELRARLEAMQAVMGEKTCLPPTPLPGDTSLIGRNFQTNQPNFSDYGQNRTFQDFQMRPCTCAPQEEKGGFFKCLMSSILPSQKPKSPLDIPTKEEKPQVSL